jgi:Zn-finger nucleic acid-binding protein
VPIWRCTGCEGRLIRREQLPRIIIREEMEFSPEVREATNEVRMEGLMNRGRYVPLTPPTLPCPSCGRVMDRAFYWAILPYRVEMDVCPGCDLIWFDRHELEIIQCLSESFSGSR